MKLRDTSLDSKSGRLPPHVAKLEEELFTGNRECSGEDQHFAIERSFQIAIPSDAGLL